MRARRPGLLLARSLALALPGCALATALHAQVGATVGIESDHRYRGVSLSDDRPVPRLTVNYDAPQRWYAGVFATRAILVGNAWSTQLTGYAGWWADAGDDRRVEVGIDATRFAGVSGYDFAQAYVGLLARTWSARLYWAPDYYGRHVGVGYLEFNAHAAVDDRVRVFAHAGALVPLGSAEGDAGQRRADVALGAGFVVGGWDFHIAGVGATPSGPYPAVYRGRRAAVVAGAAFSF